jgi:hypothetical protein
MTVREILTDRVLDDSTLYIFAAIRLQRVELGNRVQCLLQLDEHALGRNLVASRDRAQQIDVGAHVLDDRTVGDEMLEGVVTREECFGNR